MQFMTNMIGDNKILLWILAAAAILLAALIGVLLYRLVFGRRLRGGGGRARQPRLGVVDAYDLDRHRQLVIVRRDNIEHLVMIGGPNDILIESTIVRAQPAGMSQDARTVRDPAGIAAGGYPDENEAVESGRPAAASIALAMGARQAPEPAQARSDAGAAPASSDFDLIQTPAQMPAQMPARTPVAPGRPSPPAMPPLRPSRDESARVDLQTRAEASRPDASRPDASRPGEPAKPEISRPEPPRPNLGATGAPSGPLKQPLRGPAMAPPPSMPPSRSGAPAMPPPLRPPAGPINPSAMPPAMSSPGMSSPAMSPAPAAPPMRAAPNLQSPNFQSPNLQAPDVQASGSMQAPADPAKAKPSPGFEADAPAPGQPNADPLDALEEEMKKLLGR